jgi:predicted Zn-dependent peptidase
MTTRKNNTRPKMCIIHGYKVLFVPRGEKLLHIECVIRNGFCTETKHMSGINHLLEHIMVESWKHCKTSCNTYWDNKGYSVNASTDKTTMSYYIKGLNIEWEKMLTFIVNIIDNPNITEERLKKEKEAVIEELLTYSTDIDSTLDDTFNKLFYKLDGLKYGDDWKLQINNLKHITVKDIHDMYNKYFNVDNIMFVIMGAYNEKKIKAILQNQLLHSKQGKKLKVDCYTYYHNIVYVKENIENTKVMLGFPSKVHNYIYVNSVVTLLHTLLFNELRTKHSLLYDIEINFDLNGCGTTTFINFDVQSIHVKDVLVIIYKFIQDLQTKGIQEDINGFKNKEIYDYLINENSIMDYYLSLIYVDSPLYTKSQIIQAIKTMNMKTIIKLFQSLLPLDKVLCVYQCKQNLNLSWEKLI